MDVTPLIRAGTQVIQSYSGGRFRVSGAVYEGAVIVFPDGVSPWNALEDYSSLIADHFKILAEKSAEIDVVLLGTGKAMQILTPALRQQLKTMGLSVEAMDTGAACRTYNVLMAEGRRVAAALLPAI